MAFSKKRSPARQPVSRHASPPYQPRTCSAYCLIPLALDPLWAMTPRLLQLEDSQDAPWGHTVTRRGAATERYVARRGL